MTGRRCPSSMICHCCAMIASRPPTRAVYWWTGPNGYHIPVCADCASEWLANALDDDWLMPQRIATVP